MTSNADNPVRDFLMSRRAQVQPESVGLPRGRRRRVTGLRREEVASLAGISAEYYTQIERGEVSRVSDDVLQAVANAIRLDPVETGYLISLVHGARRPAGPPEPAQQVEPSQALPPTIRSIIAGMSRVAVLALSGSLDIVAANPPGRALHAPVFDRAEKRPNLARFMFEDPQSRSLFPDWSLIADECVAMLRLETSRSPGSARLRKVVDTLTASETFAARWRDHDVAQHHSGTKRFNHPQAGPMTLQFQALTAPGIADLTLYCYTPVDGDEQTSRTFASLLEISGAPDES
ncbi:helix-turn-helix transcriptional regulator [Actinomyces viscosus]|uniref:helix-turn-helix domain-containing protein n=1 Tax=Actinomyces viscosus TaxID=1656 RepID=UPI0028E1A278|nr:helix-turn-helix transcriptional regulator [Actinomyces viscosus]